MGALAVYGLQIPTSLAIAYDLPRRFEFGDDNSDAIGSATSYAVTDGMVFAAGDPKLGVIDTLAQDRLRDSNWTASFAQQNYVSSFTTRKHRANWRVAWLMNLYNDSWCISCWLVKRVKSSVI